MLDVAVLVSGRGSNLEALLRHEREDRLGARITLVVCNHPGATAVQVARSYGVECFVCEYPRSDDARREAAQEEMSELMADRGVGLVVLAGYDRVLTSQFVRRWQGRVINVHPSLLPAFGGGLHAQEEALRYGVKVSGCTVHFVTQDVDSGPIISQAAVPVLPGDDVESLSARIREQEQRLLPEAVRLYGCGRLRVEGRRVRVEE